MDFNFSFFFLFVVFGSNFDFIFKCKSIDDMVLFLDGKGFLNMEFFIIVMYFCVDFGYNLGILFSYSVF